MLIPTSSVAAGSLSAQVPQSLSGLNTGFEEPLFSIAFFACLIPDPQLINHVHKSVKSDHSAHKRGPFTALNQAGGQSPNAQRTGICQILLESDPCAPVRIVLPDSPTVMPVSSASRISFSSRVVVYPPESRHAEDETDRHLLSPGRSAEQSYSAMKRQSSSAMRMVQRRTPLKKT